jgi:hypothetical protein
MVGEVNDELERMWNEAVMVNLGALSMILALGLEENYENSQSG